MTVDWEQVKLIGAWALLALAAVAMVWDLSAFIWRKP